MKVIIAITIMEEWELEEDARLILVRKYRTKWKK